MLIANPGDYCERVARTTVSIITADGLRDRAAHGGPAPSDDGLAVPGWWIQEALRDRGELPDDGERFVARVMAAIRREMLPEQRVAVSATCHFDRPPASP